MKEIDKKLDAEFEKYNANIPIKAISLNGNAGGLASIEIYSDAKKQKKFGHNQQETDYAIVVCFSNKRHLSNFFERFDFSPFSLSFDQDDQKYYKDSVTIEMHTDDPRKAAKAFFDSLSMIKSMSYYQ